MFVYPSDTVLIRLGIMSVVAMIGLCDDTTCIIKSTANSESLRASQRTEGQSQYIKQHGKCNMSGLR